MSIHQVKGTVFCVVFMIVCVGYAPLVQSFALQGQRIAAAGRGRLSVLQRTVSTRSAPASSTAGLLASPSGSNNKTSSNTGGLRRLPVVKQPDELMNKARKVSRSVRADRSVVLMMCRLGVIQWAVPCVVVLQALHSMDEYSLYTSSSLSSLYVYPSQQYQECSE